MLLLNLPQLGKNWNCYLSTLSPRGIKIRMHPSSSLDSHWISEQDIHNKITGARVWERIKRSARMHRSTTVGGLNLPSTTQRTMSVVLNRTAISNSSDTLVLQLFDDEVIAVLDEFVTHEEYSAWNGHLDNETGSSVTFILRGGSTYGEIEYINGTGQKVIIELVESLLIEEESNIPDDTNNTESDDASTNDTESNNTMVSKRDTSAIVIAQKAISRICTFHGFTATAGDKEFGIGECSDHINWTDAAIECTNALGQLATIHSATENDQIKTLAEPYKNDSNPWSGTWLGMEQSLTTWHKWIDGSSVTYTNWKAQEPDSTASTTAVGLHLQSGQWNDYKPYDHKIKTFLCEKIKDAYCTFNGITANADGRKYGIGVCDKPVSWTQAAKGCRDIRGNLATIHSSTASAQIKDLIEPYKNTSCSECGTWIGMDKTFTTYKNWIDSSAVTYTDWDTNEPSNSSFSDLKTAVGIKFLSGKWNGYVPMTTNIKTYICVQPEALPRSCFFDGYKMDVDGYKYGFGKCSEHIPYEVAVTECEAAFGQLATIRSTEAGNKITSLFTDYVNAECLWCGTWMGMERSSTSFTGEEPPAIGLVFVSGELNTYPSDSHMKTFVCEQQKDSQRACNFKGFTVTGGSVKYGIGECNASISWADAREECRRSFGELAADPIAADSNKIMSSLFAHYSDVGCPSCGAWIGMRFTSTKAYPTRWMNGGRITNDYWAHNKPSMSKKESAIGKMFISGKWKNYPPLTENIKTFLCHQRKVYLVEPRTCHFRGFTISGDDMNVGIGECNQNISWSDAYNECKKFSAELASIRSRDMNIAMIDLVEPFKKECLYCAAWIGMHSTISGYENWMDGSLAIYKNWFVAYRSHPTEPSYMLPTHRGQSPVALRFSKVKFVDHFPIDSHVKSYMCEQLQDIHTSCKFNGYTVNADESDYGIGECNGRISWTDAVKECRKSRGVLATVRSLKANTKITTLFSPYTNESCSTCGAWIGLDKSFTTYTKWVNGSEVCFTNWAANQPNASDDISAVGMLFASGKWNTYSPLSSQVKTFVCEQPEDGPRTCGFHGFKDNIYGYHKFGIGECDQPITWGDATEECKKSLGQLATLESSVATEIILSLLEPYKKAGCPGCAAWIGLEKTITTYERWIDGSRTFYTNWNDNEPSDDSLGESAVGILYYKNGTWNDYPFNTNIKTYVCELQTVGPRFCNFNGYTVSADGIKYGLGECTKPINWTDAQSECKKSFGGLATIHSADANEMIRTLFTPVFDANCAYCGAWIGIERTGKEYKKWINASDLKYTNWGENEPGARALTGDAVVMMFKGGKWNDYPRSSIVKSFICSLAEDAPRVCHFKGFTVNVENHNYGIGECSKPISWDDAEKECRAVHGGLAIIPDSEANEKIRNLLKPYRDLSCSQCGAWIGLKHNGLAWSTGSQNMRYSNWAQNEPNGADIGEIVVGMMYMNGKWNDYFPLTHINTYICKQDENRYCRDKCDKIQLLVLYSQHTVAQFNNATWLENRIALAVEHTRQAFTASHVWAVSVELHTKQINYRDSGYLSTELSRLKDPSDGYMDEAHLYRANVNADLVVYITGRDLERVNCGLAYRPRKDLGFSPDLGFSVINGHHDFSCLMEYFVAHEIGHNMGLNHQHGYPGNSANPIEPYGYGYDECHGDLYGLRYRTIMAGQCLNEPTETIRLGVFSNPDLKFTNGRKTGTGSANNAAVLRWTCLKIANYKCSNPVPTCGGVFTNGFGNIESPNYASAADGRRDCVWIIKPKGWGRIKLQFTTHILEQSENCTDGYVEVYGGLSPYSTLLKRFCGTSNPGDIYSLVGTMYIRFVSRSRSTSTRIIGQYLMLQYINECPLTTGETGLCADQCTADDACATTELCCPSDCGGRKCMTKTGVNHEKLGL